MLDCVSCFLVVTRRTARRKFEKRHRNGTSCRRQAATISNLMFPTPFLDYSAVMSKKSARIAVLLQGCQNGAHSAHYLGYFECFNRGLFYEAHDVLEELWLPMRQEPDGLFYKGLIQLAGAFVHLQKNRLRPAAALFRLARRNLETYPASHERLAVAAVIVLMDHWCAELEACEYAVNPLREDKVPRIELLPREH